MNILVTGGAGFLGSRVIEALLQADALDLLPADGRIISLDLSPCPHQHPRLHSVLCDIADAACVSTWIDAEVHLVFHLAAVVSSQAETDFELGMRINLDATRMLLELCRQRAEVPRLVFASSLAVFGGELPQQVGDEQGPLPQSSYGMQKAAAELLIQEYARRGWVDGRICRLPTIAVRPGPANAAASSFVSGIIREPLAGQPSNCPVSLDTRLWLSSPAQVVANLLQAARLAPELLGRRRCLNLPGISVTLAQMLDSLERLAGPEARALVRRDPDPLIAAIVCSWPGNFDISRALHLGFGVDQGFEQIVHAFQQEQSGHG